MTLITVDAVPADISRRPGAPGRAPFTVRHVLADSPLLDQERLAELAASLPSRSIEHNLGSVPALLPGGVAPQLGMAPAEIVRGIESNGCWIVLKNIEADPAYRALLGSCVAELARMTPDEGAVVLQEGFVFLSSPGSVTPAHIDPEHNVLLQIRGTKTVSIGRFEDDAEMVRQVESLHGGGHRNVLAAPVDLVDFPLVPGVGVYVPVHAPHLVRNGAAVSVSLSVTWRTRETLLRGRVHGFNGVLRARGVPVGPVGAHPRRDNVKALAWRAGQAASRRLRRN